MTAVTAETRCCYCLELFADGDDVCVWDDYSDPTLEEVACWVCGHEQDPDLTWYARTYRAAS